jgi:branched-chain amino acid transport system permease protein
LGLPPKRWLILVQVAAWANHQPGAKAADQSAAFFLPSSLSLANALGIHIGVNLSPMDFVNFLIQLLNSVQYGLLLFMLAAGLTLIFGIMGVVNLAHGSFYMLGAYLAWSLAALTNSFTLAIVIGTLLSVLFGLLLEWLLFRHFYKRDHLDQVLLTFGLIYVFEETRSILWGDDVHGVTIPDALSASIPLTETLSYPVYRLFMSGVCLLLALGLYLLISKTRLGMKIRAGAFNHEMTEALGVNIKLIHALVFAMGVGLATIAGMVAAPVSSVYPNMGSQVLIMCFVVVVIGGIGSVKGALIAALLVGLVDTFGKVLLPQVAGMLVYVLMAIVLLYKPEGLFKN